MPGPAVLQPYHAAWPGRAAQLLAAVEQAMEPLRVGVSFEHIGSTSVPGLLAKASIDLQVLVSELPRHELLDQALAPTGFVPTTGSRPDSPGVHRDVPRGSEQSPTRCGASGSSSTTSTDREPRSCTSG